MFDSNSLTGPRKPSNSDDNMIPLINIVFLLLIFFMVAGQIRAMPDASLVLPKAELAEIEQETQLQLELLADGQLLLDGVFVSPDELDEQLQQLGSPDTINVALFADEHATAVELDKAMAVLRRHQLQSVLLHSETREGSQP